MLADGTDNTTSNTVSVSLAGTDDLSGVSHYYLSEDSTTPAADAAGWASYETSSEFVLSASNGLKTVYLWIKDAAGNVSGSLADTIELLAATSATGTLEWTRQLGTSSHDFATGIATDSSGNVYVTGSTEGTLDGSNAGERDLFLMKLSQ